MKCVPSYNSQLLLFMSKSVVINLGSGDLYNGFPIVTAQLWSAGTPRPQQFVGSLAAAPTLIELYKIWQSNYKNICNRQYLRFPNEYSHVNEDDELEIDTFGITNVSVIGFEELCQQLQQSINTWLKSCEFLNIDKQLRSQLHPTDEIQVIFQTSDNFLRRLPWHRWDFFKDYPKAEIAISRPEYKRGEKIQLKSLKKKIRILAILGNSKGINLEIEIQFLENLKDSEVVFLVNPSRQEFNTYLWQQPGWDILFFAGHSQTEGEIGRIYINSYQTNNSLTIEQLQEALKAAIDNGLQLAIFNSCDGLGLGLSLEKLNIPTTIVMREPVPNLVAEEFFRHFMAAFAIERLPLYLAVQQARRKLQGLEDEFPGASWLPVICQNPAVEPPTWLKLGGIPPCPYRGLFAFREQDAHLFFGREELTRKLVTAVKKKSLVAVVGASGSGKTSVVHAGLIPKLRQDTNVQWQIISFRPGKNPFEALATAVSALHTQDATNPHSVELELVRSLKQDDKALSKIIEKFVQQNFGTRLVLVIDQFEEVYTLCPPSERKLVLDGLLNAIKLAPAFTLVLTLRDDFYKSALSYRPLSDALQGAVFNLTSMSREELRDCIEKPAAQMQVGLEKELTNQLINEVKDRPHYLPLLEFALTQLWSKQSQGFLTYHAYEEIGGVEFAIDNHAEEVYAQLTEADRKRAQRLFIQLVRPQEGSQPTRKLVTRDQIGCENWDLLTRLADAHLVVRHCHKSNLEETVEIVHEALIQNWRRLEHWIRVENEFRRWQEELREAIRQWEKSGKQERILLQGKPLIDAEYWYERRWDDLSSEEKLFTHLNLKLQEREINRQKSSRKVVISGLVSGLVIASILAGTAVWQWQKARVREIQSPRSAEVLGSKQAIAFGERLHHNNRKSKLTLPRL
jgi:energy-coupling factor transporter ATP-binding protein EcfA2